jgi:hypothetical protein
MPLKKKMNSYSFTAEKNLTMPSRNLDLLTVAHQFDSEIVIHQFNHTGPCEKLDSESRWSGPFNE